MPIDPDCFLTLKFQTSVECWCRIYNSGDLKPDAPGGDLEAIQALGYRVVETSVLPPSEGHPDRYLVFRLRKIPDEALLAEILRS